MSKASMKSVVFVTGTFLGSNCWDEWKFYFENKGYKCIAPAWPFKDASPEELRNRHTDAGIASNTITSLTDHFAAIISSLPEKPILIGHSVGGLVVQLLMQRDLAVGGVAVHPFPSQGVNRFRFSFLKAVWETMVLFSPHGESYLMSFRKWKYAIANGMVCEEQKQLYYKYATPESKVIIRDIFKCSTKIDFKRATIPLLIISGGKDKLIPASLNYSTHEKYAASGSVTYYKEFEDHNHLVFDYPAGTEEADFVLHWLRVLL